MKIGFFYPQYYPLTSGVSVHGFAIAERLARKGHQLLCATGDKNPACTRYPQTKRGMLRLTREADVFYVRVTPYFEHVGLWKLLRPGSLPVVWEINAPLEEQFAGHNLISPELARQKARRKFYARFVDAAVCVSDNLRDYARRVLGIQRAYTVPNGGDPRLFESAGRSVPEVLARCRGDFKIIWSGNPALPWQAMSLMLEAARILRAKDPGIKFVFISADAEYVFPDQDNIIVLRGIKHAEIPLFLNQADICLCLYNDYSWSGCGFYNSPLKLFDYMAAAKPVIASDMGQIAQVIRDNENGFLIGADAGMLADKIMALKNAPQKRRQAAQEAKQTIIDYYNWDRTVDQIETILGSVLKS